MSIIVLSLLLTLLQPPADPGLAARWTSAISAVISWRQEERGCLYRNSTFVGCWDAAGAYRVTLGGPLTDGALRPAAGDVYELRTQGMAWCAQLRGVVWLAMANE